MRKVLGAALAVLLAVPLFVMVLVGAVLAPATAQQVAAQPCAGPLPATGDWRPPFQQAYSRGPVDYGTPVDSAGSSAPQPVLQTGYRTEQGLTSQPGPGPVVAAAAGTVTSAGVVTAGSSDAGTTFDGVTVRIRHAGGVETRYTHLASLDPAVAVGAQLAIGQPLGLEGATGLRTAAYLGYRVDVDGQPVDPVAFMREHGAPLDGAAVAASPGRGAQASNPVSDSDGEGGVGFTLPLPGPNRRASLTNPPSPIPAPIQGLYRAAGARYAIPWTLLAGVGMEETGHGRLTATSSAGALGLMQFLPATWTTFGVDGDGDGRADITNDADSVASAANYLTRSGVTKGPDGVRAALFAYNHADWYVDDVLYYAGAYGSGTVLGDAIPCAPATGPGSGGDGTGAGNPDLPPLTDDRVAQVLTWAQSHVGDAYVMGANGPSAWDCSSYTRTAYSQIGISLPRTAQAQRDWLAQGNGSLIPLGQERPGDLVFWDSYLGPNTIGHVMLVFDPAGQRTIEAHGSSTGVGYFSYANGPAHAIFQIWRVGNLTSTHP